jgi:hypothetical protein
MGSWRRHRSTSRTTVCQAFSQFAVCYEYSISAQTDGLIAQLGGSVVAERIILLLISGHADISNSNAICNILGVGCKPHFFGPWRRGDRNTCGQQRYTSESHEGLLEGGHNKAPSKVRNVTSQLTQAPATVDASRQYSARTIRRCPDAGVIEASTPLRGDLCPSQLLWKSHRSTPTVMRTLRRTALGRSRPVFRASLRGEEIGMVRAWNGVNGSLEPLSAFPRVSANHPEACDLAPA